jgi:putative ABC transport system permease protein
MIVGLLAALALMQFIRAQIYGVHPFDPGTVATAILLMALTALAAVYLPARHAARVDPIRALRGEH